MTMVKLLTHLMRISHIKALTAAPSVYGAIYRSKIMNAFLFGVLTGAVGVLVIEHFLPVAKAWLEDKLK